MQEYQKNYVKDILGIENPFEDILGIKNPFEDFFADLNTNKPKLL